MHDETADWRRWGARLCHPLPLAAVLLMTVNDHVLKGSGVVPSALAGKLSDLAGLFFFPLVLAAGFALLLRVAGLRASERAVGRAALLATGLVFAGLKLSPGFNLAVERLWAPNTLDRSDLLALPMLGLSWAWMRRRERPRRLPAEVIAVVVAGLASVATQFSRIERVYPRWVTPEQARLALGCARVEAWVAKTGKEGAGVTLAARATSEPCRLTVRGSRFVVGRVDVEAPEAPAVLDLSAAADSHLWLSHVFDGDSAWNAGTRAGVLRLDLEAGGELRTWELPVTLTLEGGRQFRPVRPEPVTPRRAEGGGP